jgi:hypothetical protein
MNPTEQFTKGHILYGRINSDAKHPIIYLSEKDDDYFIGAMITHNKSHKGRENVLMNESHIETHDEKGKKHEFQFDNSHFVLAKLIKKNEWQPFRKTGRLTSEGIEFVENHIGSLEEVLFEDYDSQ